MQMHTTTAIYGFAIALTLQSTASAQFTWTQLSPTSTATHRAGHAMAYDTQRGATVLFGGFMNFTGYGNYLGDTWEWNGSGWTPCILANSPGARANHSMVYDSQRGVIVLFGGSNLATYRLGDTWEWNGTSWTQRATSGPSARRSHAMAYDSLRGVTVMFGGQASFGQGDTWEWNGTTWTQRATTGPLPRMQHVATFDSMRGVTVMFGGYNQMPGYYNDLWEWNGTQWTQRVPSGFNGGPPGRIAASMTYDQWRGRTVLHGGGGDNGTPLRDTWEWNGIAWEQRVANGPSEPTYSALAYDGNNRSVIMFGGMRAGSSTAETWELQANIPATSNPYGGGCGTPPLTLTSSAISPPTIGTTAQAIIGNMPSGIGAMAMGWSGTTLGSFGLPLSLASWGAPGCNIWTSTEIAHHPIAPGGFAATFSLPIPLIGVLLDARLYLQAHAFAPGYNAANIVVSNGLQWKFGN